MISYEPGYRLSWQWFLGGVEPEIFSDNVSNWSGDHGGVWSEDIKGIFFSNRRFDEPTPTSCNWPPRRRNLG